MINDTLAYLRNPTPTAWPGVEALPRRVIHREGDWEQILLGWRPQAEVEPSGAVLLYLHGGGFQNGAPDGAETLARYLALTLGLTTYSASYRLASPGRPTWPAVLDDVERAWTAVLGLAEACGLDPIRVGIGGESAGGCLATLALVLGRLPGCRALVDFWGPVDLVARWFDKGEAAGPESILLGVNYTDNPALYHQASAVTHVHAGLPPALFIYGRQDPLVHPRQGALVHAAWQAYRNHSEFHVYPNIGHGVVGDHAESLSRAFEKTRDFLDARLVGRP